MAVNQNYGPGAKKYLKTRAVTALPLLMLGLLADKVFSNILSQAPLQGNITQPLKSGQIEFGAQAWSLPTNSKPFNFLVTLFSLLVLNINPLQRIQTTSFLIDLAPL
ncbi:uncharacterized protein Z519_09120 [Cladophialophora bantiana CBS 173.52]|uniref:Uncharacterized protein n=1 Tax=Cladophialophora bantiana (strain ATCC 10958 / CBS 173.52 / CDC B-1940 / NIH 8579) TaxID=1442370 RepID=A0A0D2I0W6_CLAB1|nr:uncharacterized protein Z519_09120 [Cladophialophora bantiana CBS 173.52]KIW90474.1 hypothetical protein Z519_09120 [Cladophialophora bantiana CBS 173.52]